MVNFQRLWLHVSILQRVSKSLLHGNIDIEGARETVVRAHLVHSGGGLASKRKTSSHGWTWDNAGMIHYFFALCAHVLGPK